MGKVTEEEIIEFLKPLAALGEEQMNEVIPSQWEVPEGYILNKMEVNGSLAEHLIPEEKGTDLVIYHLHGGAYAYRYLDVYRDVALHYSKAAGGAEVISLDYGCAPNHVFPSALEESVKVYKWMLDQGIDSKNIVIAGDSAGGNLTMVTTMYLRDNKLPMPKALITISPWVSLASDFDSIERNKEKDLLLGTKSPGAYKIVLHPIYAGDTDMKTPYLSPLYGDFHEFPTMLIQCGNYGILFDSIDEAAKKIKEAGVDITYTVYEGMSHDFQLMLPMLDETPVAWKEIEDFFKKIK